MKLNEAIEAAYNRKWSMINSFTVYIHMPAVLEDDIGTLGDSVNLNIISFTTPDITNEPIESFTGNRWVIQNGKDQLYRFTITFRDQNQMSLYKAFWKIYQKSKNNYFDDVKLLIDLYKDADWASEEDTLFMSFENTLIEGISNLSFSNDTENQIAEFTVSLKCTEIVLP